MSVYLAYGYAAAAMIAGGFALGIFTLARNPPVDTPRLGVRGHKRQQAQSEGGSFSSI